MKGGRKDVAGGSVRISEGRVRRVWLSWGCVRDAWLLKVCGGVDDILEATPYVEGTPGTLR